MSTIAPGSPPSSPVISLENFHFEYAEADVIIRSSDSYEFRVLKIYISHSSPVLRDQVAAISFPQWQSGVNISAGTSLPVVQLFDSGAVLFSLLTYIFPVPPVLPSTVEHTIELLSAAQRYRMDAILTHVRNHIAQQEPPFIREENSFLVFSLARNRGLNQEALRAARSSLKLPTFTIDVLEERLQLISCASLYALWRYRQKFQHNLESLLPDFVASSGRKTLKGSGCTGPAASGIPGWLDRYISLIGRTPSHFSLSMFYAALRNHVRSSSNVIRDRCHHCATIDIPALWAALSAMYDDSVSEVRESDSI